MKLLFVAGTDLSGSTVLDLALGSLPNVVGLGEVDNLLSSDKRALGEVKVGNAEELICTCGQKGSACAIWGPTLSFLEASPEALYEEKYTVLVDAVLANYPETVAIVDSSKQISALKKVANLPDYDLPWLQELAIVALWRGPLSWLSSDSRRAARRNQTRTRKIIFRRLRKWANRNRELLRFARNSRFNFVFLTLRNFQKNPEVIRSAITVPLNIPFPENMAIDISRSTSHVLWGSHHRLDPSKSKTISRNSRQGAFELLYGLSVLVLSPAVFSAYKEFIFLILRSLFLRTRTRVEPNNRT